MKACSVICRKATVALSYAISSLPGANPHLPEHKIGVFVRFWLPEPPLSGFSSTKSRFLCAFGQYFLGFSPRRAQNRGFCALFSETVGFAGRGNLISASAGRGNLVGASAERGNLVAASARRGNLFSAPAWSCNLIAARTASRFAVLSCRLSSHRGKWRGITAPTTGVSGEGLLLLPPR